MYNPGEERGANGSQNESHNGSHNFPPATVKNRIECVMGDDSNHCILKKSGGDGAGHRKQVTMSVLTKPAKKRMLICVFVPTQFILPRLIGYSSLFLNTLHFLHNPKYVALGTNHGTLWLEWVGGRFIKGYEREAYTNIHWSFSLTS